MTMEKALQVTKLVDKISDYEMLRAAIDELEALDEVENGYGDNIRVELDAIVKTRLDKFLKELDEL